VRAPIQCLSRPGPLRPGIPACVTRRRVADLALSGLRRVHGGTAQSRWLIIAWACASRALPVMPHPRRHWGRLISIPRRRTRTRHRSPPGTGCALSRLTSAPTRTGPAHGGAAARGRWRGGSVRTPELCPDLLVAAARLTQAGLLARTWVTGRLSLLALRRARACLAAGPARRPPRVKQRPEPARLGPELHRTALEVRPGTG